VNIGERLANEHSSRLTNEIIAYVGNDEKRFSELMTQFMHGESRIRQRAAWPLGYIGASHPRLMKPYYGRVLKMLHDEKEHPAIARNILRIFQEAGVPARYESMMIDYCFKNFMNPSRPPAIRAMSITIASRISGKYKELENEFLPMLRELQPMKQPAAVLQRIKLALKERGHGFWKSS
jgi:hypothetical protein